MAHTAAQDMTAHARVQMARAKGLDAKSAAADAIHEMRPRIGLLDLRDLGGYPWQPHRLDAHLGALGLAGEGPATGFRAFEPPPCLIVVADGLFPEVVAAHRGWLTGASTVIAVRDRAADEASLADPEMTELVDLEWRAPRQGAAGL